MSSENPQNSSVMSLQSNLRHLQWQVHQRRLEHELRKTITDEDNKQYWTTQNGEFKEDKVIPDSLAMLENLVHPEEELLDEINDRQIIQAVISSMAQWNLRKLQKMQRKLDQTR